MQVLEENHKRQYEELEAGMLLWKKESEMQRAFEQKKMELKLKMRC